MPLQEILRKEDKTSENVISSITKGKKIVTETIQKIIILSATMNKIKSFSSCQT